MHAPKSTPLPSDLPDIAADVLARLRERKPRVHCITNAGAQAFTANVLLAVGALPSMTVAPEEIAQFVAGAGLGSFTVEIVDALSRLDRETLRARARVT